MQITQLFQVGHDVADGGGTQIQAGVARQRARTDRLAVADVALDQKLQQVLGALV
jgi:hypothetical protein